MICQTCRHKEPLRFTFLNDDGNPIGVGYQTEWSSWADFRVAFDRDSSLFSAHTTPLSEFRDAYDLRAEIFKKKDPVLA